jgi:hypothetical protein
MTQKHTPTPWSYKKGSQLITYGSAMVAHVYAGGDNVVGQSRKETREANAEFIVRAINVHDELVKALLKINQLDGHIHSVEDASNIAGTALAKARGETQC